MADLKCRHFGMTVGIVAADFRIRGCAVCVALADQLDERPIALDRQQLERCAAIVEVREPWEQL